MMIPVTTRAAQNLAVFGLGASGRATARALVSGGARVVAWDDAEASRAAAGAENIALAEPGGIDWARQSALVLSPGVPLTHPRPHAVVERAVAAGIAVIGDIELMAECCRDAVLVAVTGTNGKSTAAALLAHICSTAGRRAQLGGNIGRPALDLDPPAPGEVVILELSSFQLELTRDAAFDIAILLNLTPDHLDRHGSMAGYAAAKRRIFRSARDGRPQSAVVSIDDDRCRAIHDELAAGGRFAVRSVSVEAAAGVQVVDGILVDAGDGESCDLSAAAGLRGPHNWQNAAAAWTAARMLGIAPDAIRAALPTFRGLLHRMETVAVIDGIRYVNDSKATNGDAAARALASFSEIYWIAGGIAKEDGLAPAAPWLGNVRHAYLIGEAAASFGRELRGRVPCTRSGSLERAVRAARSQAAADGAREPVVLLSPAGASFDRYRNFAARGEHFRTLVLDGAPGEAG